MDERGESYGMELSWINMIYVRQTSTSLQMLSEFNFAEMNPGAFFKYLLPDLY